MTDMDLPDDNEELLIRLYSSIMVAQTEEQLDDLPTGTITMSEFVPDTPPIILVKNGISWGGGNAKPSIPALILVSGEELPTYKRPRRAARNSDPATSKKAAMNSDRRWDSMTIKALRVFYHHRDEPQGLTHDQVQHLADDMFGKGALGRSPWKRSGELNTLYDPPLIEMVLDEHGAPLEVDGGHGDKVNTWRISTTGIQWCKAKEARGDA